MSGYISPKYDHRLPKSFKTYDAFPLRTGGSDNTLSLMSGEELKSSVARLSAEELASFSQWFEEFMADRWDKQIEADILAGLLDAAGQRADTDYRAGRCTPLLL